MKSFSKHDEIFCMIVIFLFLICFSYFIFLRNTVNVFLLTKSNYANAKIVYEKKLAQKNDIKKIMLQLHHWQKTHPQFFKAFLMTNKHHSISEQLTSAFQQSHFQITHITNSKKKNTIAIESTGNYSDLFTLITQFNLEVLPVKIERLQIDHVHHFTIELTRDMHAKK